jgi:CheY-like chemotaxis protein
MYSLTNRMTTINNILVDDQLIFSGSDRIGEDLEKRKPVKEEKDNAKQVLSENFALEFPLRILVAEDNEINQKLTIAILAKLGFQAALACNGKEVLDMADHEHYDLILMDVQMPEMDGLEATRYIRENYKRQPVIIAMTANAMVEDREECIRAGMNDYIAKPVKIETLITMLRETDFPVHVPVQIL